MVTAEASSGGRRITLDPISPLIPITVEVREVESTIPCGFQLGWFEGTTDEGVDFEMLSGAGLGSPWLTFKVGDKHYCLNGKDILTTLLNSVGV